VQVPKDLLQPVPQWPVVDPHHPYWLQQFPNVEPVHVKPWVPAHVPSVEAFLVETGAAEDDTLVEEAALGVLEAAFEEETAPEPEQVPKAELQVEPQWSVVEPHQPYCEQQLPKEEPVQVKP
tara:strand:- start:46414 stop:46779 length:366 start_codon:yes stop_codon:yes gene_type:complete